jgi:Rrf2 family transcriptional regulator, cysteine metabolism repressor
MKLSLKVEYACQVLAQLGHSYGRTPLPHIEELAKAEAVPSNYLVQILNELRTSGLIVSKRGKQGGYALARDPKDISLFEVVCAVEGALLEISPPNAGASTVRTKEIWRGVAQELEARTKTITVRDIMGPPGEDMYYI